MSFTQFNLFGNVLDVRPVGENKVIVFEVPFKTSSVFDVVAFAPQAEEVNAIEDALTARRAETDDESAILTDIYLTVRLMMTPPTKNNNIMHNQVQLIRVGASEPKVIETEVTKPPVETEDPFEFTDDNLTLPKLILTWLLFN